MNVYVYTRLTLNERARLRRCVLVINCILVPPTIRVQSSIVYGTIGKSVQLQCLANGPFDTKISWQRMDNQTTSQFRQQEHVIGDLIRTSLYIKEIEKQDLGFYDCSVESTSGKSYARIELRGKKILFSSRRMIIKYFFFHFAFKRTSSPAWHDDHWERWLLNITYPNTQTK